MTCRVDQNDNTSLQWSNPAQQTLYFDDKKGEYFLLSVLVIIFWNILIIMNLFFWSDSNYSFWLPNCYCLYLNMLNIKYFSLQVINTKDNLHQLSNKINNSNSVSKIALCLLLTIAFYADTQIFFVVVTALCTCICWIFFSHFW